MCRLSDVPLRDIFRFAEAWRDLGDSVQDQVKEIVFHPSSKDVNMNAIELAQKRLRGMHAHLDEAFETYLNWRNEEEKYE
jgi:hypothetical protein